LEGQRRPSLSLILCFFNFFVAYTKIRRGVLSLLLCGSAFKGDGFASGLDAALYAKPTGYSLVMIRSQASGPDAAFDAEAARHILVVIY
jgi:hypothetical protein